MEEGLKNFVHKIKWSKVESGWIDQQRIRLLFERNKNFSKNQNRGLKKVLILDTSL